jgi:hypothetical protein
MDENVLAAALRLNEPITFGRIEPLHDTGRHRTLSPFRILMIPVNHTESKDVDRHARPYCLLAITNDQSELDHRPAPASYSPARIQAIAPMRRFGSRRSNSGLVLARCRDRFEFNPTLPFAARLRCSAARQRSCYSITSSARVRIDCGIVRPSASAVVRLTTSNLVGCSTGMSAGFARARFYRLFRRCAGTDPSCSVRKTRDPGLHISRGIEDRRQPRAERECDDMTLSAIDKTETRLKSSDDGQYIPSLVDVFIIKLFACL